MGDIRTPQNPGIGSLSQLTSGELAFVQNIADHTYTNGQLIIGNGSTGGISIATLTQGSGITITNGAGTITIASSGGSGLTIGTSTITSGTDKRILYDNAGVLGEYTITGTGTVVAMATAPTFVTSITTPSVLATADDSGALGASGTAFSDLFLASGAVINYASSNVLLTHSSGVLTLTGTEVIAATSATAFVVGQNGTSNPALTVNTNTASSVTGLSITSNTSGNFVGVAVTSSGSNDGLSLNAKGTGVIRLGSISTGQIQFSRTLVPTSNDGAALGTTALMFSDLFLASGGVLNFNNGDTTLTHSAGKITSTGAFVTTAAGIGVNKSNSASIALEVKADSTFTQGMRVEADISTRLGLSSFVTGDAQVRFTFRTDGVIAWGDGTSVADTNLYRTAADSLKTDDSFTVGAHFTVEGVTTTGATGTGKIVFDTAPQLSTIELGAASDTTISRVSAGVIAVEGATVATLSAAQTFTGQEKFNNIIDVNNAVTVASNAGTVPVTFRLNTFTNSSAATMAITMATASAVDGQMTIVRIYDFSAVAQTIGWTNTEDSTVTAPTTSNGSTTLPLIVGFMYNSATSKWRCIAKA